MIDIATTENKYNIIYCDPPWMYDDKCAAGKRGASFKYPLMELADIMQLPVKRLAADNCVLVMWWVPPMPQEALDLVKAWGFKLKNMKAFTWHKTKESGAEHMGMGHWTRANSEDCLIAVRGRPKRLDASIRQFISAPVGRHSAKPPEVRDRIVKLCGDVPRVHLFARSLDDGWDCWGNDVPVSFL